MINRKKVFLIDPPWVVESKENLWKKVRSCYPSLGLASVASYLERDGHDVKIMDCTADEISVDIFTKRYLDIERGFVPDFIGLTATCALFPNALEIAKNVKILNPNAIVVMGESILPWQPKKFSIPSMLIW